MKDAFDRWAEQHYDILLNSLKQDPETACKDIEQMYQYYQDGTHEIVTSLIDNKTLSTFEKICIGIIADELRDLAQRYCDKLLVEARSV